MIKLKLEANTEEEKLIKEYLENNVSEILANKINNGVKIIKDNKQLLNKKDFTGFLNYAKEQAKKSAKDGVAMIHHSVVFGWAMHYFEEDSIEGKLYNEDGTEYKKVVKTEYKPPVSKVEVKKKPENEQGNFLDMFNIKHEDKKDILTIEEKQTLVDIFDEPQLEEELKQDIQIENINLETGEVLQNLNNKQNEYIEILQQIFDYKLEVLL